MIVNRQDSNFLKALRELVKVVEWSDKAGMGATINLHEGLKVRMGVIKNVAASKWDGCASFDIQHCL